MEPVSLPFPENFGFREDEFDVRPDCVEMTLQEINAELGVSLLLQEYSVSVALK